MWESSSVREVKWLEDGGIEIVWAGMEELRGGPGDDTLDGNWNDDELHGRKS